MNTDISERYCWAIHIFSEAILNNSDTFRELIANNFTHSFSEFISNSYQTILHTFSRVHIKQFWHFQRVTTKQDTFFVRVHTKSYWDFRRVTTKQYYTHFSKFISHNAFSGSYYQIILHKVHIKQYWNL